MIVNCGPTIEEGYQAALQLLKLPARPTALIAINDLLAIGALRAAGDLGLHVPTDVSLVSYDDITLAQFQTPRLTTVSKDVAGAARACVKMLLARLQEPGRPYQRINMPTRLIIRESTGPAPVK
jgi:LacI family transcriptional regulator